MLVNSEFGPGSLRGGRAAAIYQLFTPLESPAAAPAVTCLDGLVGQLIARLILHDFILYFDLTLPDFMNPKKKTEHQKELNKKKIS